MSRFVVLGFLGLIGAGCWIGCGLPGGATGDSGGFGPGSGGSATSSRGTSTSHGPSSTGAGASSAGGSGGAGPGSGGAGPGSGGAASSSVASSVASTVASTAAGGTCMAGVDCSACVDCNSCFGCYGVPGGSCYQTYCAPVPDCVALTNCLNGCQDQQCVNTCINNHQTGAQAGQSVIQCTCSACPMCAGQGFCQ